MHRTTSLVLIFLTTAALSATAIAQSWAWETVEVEPAVFLSDLCVLDDEMHGWVSGWGGTGGEVFAACLRTTDGGNTWAAFEPPSGWSQPNGVFFATPDSGWMVGGGGRIYITTDGGDNWSQQTSGTSQDLARVHFLDSERGYVGGKGAGDSWLVFGTTNGGASWTDMSFGNDCYQALDIWFADTLHGWVCGWNSSLDPVIKHTSDGGATWTEQGLPVPSGAGGIASICFPTPEIGWASVTSIYHTPPGSILHTTDGGTTWTIQGQTNEHYNYLDAPDTLHCAVVGYSVLGSQRVKVTMTTDGGATWFPRTPPLAGYTYGIRYHGDNLWLASQNTYVAHSTDTGMNWTINHASPLFKSIAWRNSTDGWVVAGSHTGLDQMCRRTTDGGTTWFWDFDAPGGAQVCWHDEDHGWILKEGSSARINRTTDGGATWNSYGLGTGAWVEEFFFVSVDSGWAFGSNGTIRFTSNGGQSWTGQTSGVSEFCASVFFTSPTEGWAGGGYGGGSGFILHTTDGGQNWTHQTMAYPDHIEDLFFLDNQRGWAISAVNGKVHYTSNGGTAWQVISNGPPHSFGEVIRMQDTLTGWVIARNGIGSRPPDDGRGFVYKTTDGGAHWQQVWAALYAKGSLSGLAWQTGTTTLWAVGGHRSIIKDPTALGIEEDEMSVQTFSRQPTFVRGILRLEGDKPVALLDITGRHIMDLAPGENDVRRLASGVYFVTGSDRSERHRLVVTR
jgi:photosystem II stability/assembly factor-like uncharacterized protein